MLLELALAEGNLGSARVARRSSAPLAQTPQVKQRENGKAKVPACPPQTLPYTPHESTQGHGRASYFKNKKKFMEGNEKASGFCG